MARVKLNHRWGTNKAGSTVDVDDATAEWLRGIGYAGKAPEAAAPGTDGADPVLSGDPTRRRARPVKRAPVEGENRAAAVEGSLPARRGGYRGETRTEVTATASEDETGKHRKGTSDTK